MLKIKKWLIRRLLKKSDKKEDKSLLIADEYLKLTQQKHARTLKDAEKINKAKLLDLQEKQLRRELRQGLDDYEEEEEPEEEGPNFEENLKNMFLMKLLNPTQSQNNNSGVSDDNSFSKNTNITSFLDNNPAITPDIKEMASKLTPEQIEQLKNKFLGGL